MASISNSACEELLTACLAEGRWSDALLDQAIAEREGRDLLSIVVEHLADLFEPRLCDVYGQLFSAVIRKIAPELKNRVRKSTASPAPPKTIDRVYVLSRVTLGADVAVTSVMLDAVKRRYPDAEILFVGARKSFELFEADPRIRHYPAPYARGGDLRERLLASAELWFDDGIVIDPDSRLTQLGLVQVCEDERYFFFPSRNYGGDGQERLPTLAARWLEEVFGVAHARPYIAPSRSVEPPADITVSLGVGENETKRISDDFEQNLMKMVAATGRSVIVDKGLGEIERARVESAIPPGMRTYGGAFAPFASMIEQSKLYIGYDSAGGHVASACGVPLISIAKGFLNERMAARWRPNGVVIDGNAPDVLDRIRNSVADRLKH